MSIFSTTTTFTLTTAATLLAIGCTTQSTTAPTTSTPDAVIVTTTPEATPKSTMVATVEVEPQYEYGYDFDGDGSYTAMHTFASPRWEPVESPWKYPYTFDRDADGGHATALRPERPPVPQTATTTTVERPAIVPLMVDAALASACMAAEPTIYFSYDSSDLSEDVDRDLTTLVRCLDADVMSEVELEVVGHSDLRGPDAYNDQLARERAETVASALTEHGIEPDRIEVISMGEDAAEAPEHWDDRRVVVRLK